MNYIQHFPKPFLDDLVHGRVLPIVGAGLSMNALTPKGKRMPLWDHLGRALADDIPDYPYAGAMDAISAYAHEFTRTKLVEQLGELLLIDRAKPGEAHRAFCSLPFQLVCTTNFDFLLEQQYRNSPRFCRPVIDEDQLSIAGCQSDLMLLKLHGDLHHPQRLVVTEDDYDRFLDTYPLLATFLANLLITRTPLLIGYSLDDPDFRQVWQIIGDRLGRLRRPAYAISVDAKPTDAARFERRGVRVISLPGSREKYGAILSSAFDELGHYWSENVIPVSQITEEDSLKELALPSDAMTRLCFFSVPLSQLAFYRERVFPIAEKHGFVPISATDMISPGENWLAKIETLISRSSSVLAEISTANTVFELGLALTKKEANRIVVVTDDIAHLPPAAQRIRYVIRPESESTESDTFMSELENWFEAVAAELSPILADEPMRLLALNQHRAAVISVFILLEVKLRDVLARMAIPLTPHRSVGQLIVVANQHNLIDGETATRLSEWSRLRNTVAHGQGNVRPKQAKEIVEDVVQVIGHIEAHGHDAS